MTVFNKRNLKQLTLQKSGLWKNTITLGEKQLEKIYLTFEQSQDMSTSWRLLHILNNLKYFCGKKEAFDCADFLWK